MGLGAIRASGRAKEAASKPEEMADNHDKKNSNDKLSSSFDTTLRGMNGI